jgi:2,3-bisphosphoglycerate-dependent phosphoglycerate mutase
MKTRLIVVRHGNTFGPNDTPTRVGSRTNLDLVETSKGKAIGEYLIVKDMIPNTIYSGPLKRQIQTAELICEAIELCVSSIKVDTFFNEIDYGEDENKVEKEVRLRLGNGDETKGKQVIDLWNEKAIVPNGWTVNPKKLQNGWLEFGERVARENKNQTTLLVSSNGIIRFSAVLDPGFSYQNLKVPTGGICIFERLGETWKCIKWGILPDN